MKQIEEVLEKISHLNQKATALNQLRKQLEKENSDLKLQVNKTKKLIEIQNNSIKELENKLKTKLLGESLSLNEQVSSNDSRKLKMKINEMIKEIDLIISQLS